MKIKIHILTLCLLADSVSAFNNIDATYKNETSTKTIPPYQFILVGEGNMRWLWFNIYQAKLSTPSGTYLPEKWPLSLELIYTRNISRTKLIETTESEWIRQGISYQEQWLTKLTEIWPDISINDNLTLYVDRCGHSQFSYNGHFLGKVNDAEFTTAFTSIWLSENTLNPTLRNQLIGLKND